MQYYDAIYYFKRKFSAHLVLLFRFSSCCMLIFKSMKIIMKKSKFARHFFINSEFERQPKKSHYINYTFVSGITIKRHDSCDIFIISVIMLIWFTAHLRYFQHFLQLNYTWLILSNWFRYQNTETESEFGYMS